MTLYQKAVLEQIAATKELPKTETGMATLLEAWRALAAKAIGTK